MIFNLIPLIFVGVAAWYIYTRFIATKLDCPANNEIVKGLEKKEIKSAIKEHEQQKKDLDKEIKEIEKERKDILAGSDTDKAEKAQEKLEKKQEKMQELSKIEADLSDLKTVDKGGWKAQLPNKLSLNNGLWLGGFLFGLFFLYKLCVSIFRSLFRAIGFEEQ